MSCHQEQLVGEPGIALCHSAVAEVVPVLDLGHRV